MSTKSLFRFHLVLSSARNPFRVASANRFKRELLLRLANSVALLCICLLAYEDARGNLQPLDAGKAFKQAEKRLRAGEFAEAEALYRATLTQEEKHTGARLGLSLALLKQRKLQAAFDEASRVLVRDPQSSRAVAVLGMTLLTAGDFENSRRYFKAALERDAREALAVAGVAMIDYYENRLEASYKGLRRAVAFASKEPDYIFGLAQVASRTERYKEAAAAYEQFLRIAPPSDEDRRARIQGLIAFLHYVSTQGELYQVAGARRDAIKFELANNRPIVTVRINGNPQPLRFVVDSGSGMCVVSTEGARKLNLPVVARGGNARAIGGAGKFEIVYGFINSLAFGAKDEASVVVENVPVYIRPFYNTENPVDGYIGLSALVGHLMSLDYQDRIMTLERDTDDTVAARFAASQNNLAQSATNTTTNAKETLTDVVSSDLLIRPMEIPARLTTSGFWSSEIKIEGVSKPQNFIIDTGASISVVSEQLAEREEMNRFAQTTKMRIHGAAGITENVSLLLLPRVHFTETFARKHVPAVVLNMASINETSGFEQAGIIGGNVLRHYRVTFDFPRMIIRLEPYPLSNGGASKATTSQLPSVSRND